MHKEVKMDSCTCNHLQDIQNIFENIWDITIFNDKEFKLNLLKIKLIDISSLECDKNYKLSVYDKYTVICVHACALNSADMGIHLYLSINIPVE